MLKDYAADPEADSLRKAAHLMVTGLAQSLALVTAREPLRIAVASNLRALLSSQLDAATLEQARERCCTTLAAAAVAGSGGARTARAAVLLRRLAAGTWGRALRQSSVGHAYAAPTSTHLCTSTHPCPRPCCPRPTPLQVVAMLVTDNLDVCCQVIEKAASERAQREVDERLQGAYAARARAKAAGVTRIICEVDRLDQIAPALAAGATHLLLDNMAPGTLREAVALVAGRVPCEASGGVRLDTIAAIAASGVTYVSVGRLTQSAPAADIGLDFTPL